MFPTRTLNSLCVCVRVHARAQAQIFRPSQLQEKRDKWPSVYFMPLSGLRLLAPPGMSDAHSARPPQLCSAPEDSRGFLESMHLRFGILLFLLPSISPACSSFPRSLAFSRPARSRTAPNLPLALPAMFRASSAPGPTSSLFWPPWASVELSNHVSNESISPYNKYVLLS